MFAIGLSLAALSLFVFAAFAVQICFFLLQKRQSRASAKQISTERNGYTE